MADKEKEQKKDGKKSEAGLKRARDWGEKVNVKNEKEEHAKVNTKGGNRREMG